MDPYFLRVFLLDGEIRFFNETLMFIKIGVITLFYIFFKGKQNKRP